MERITKSTDEMVSYMELQIHQLLSHDFISQQQSQYFKNRKQNLSDGEMLVICDFSENYTFVIQDEIQAHHWVNKQCTIHPFALYWKENGEDKMKSIVFIAESLKHDVIAVHLFQNKLIDFIKKEHNVEKIVFFSDGAAGQYKNRKNFYNIAQFKNKFGIEAEWHFFATSHGKSACDGIGGTFKRNARRASLQNKQISDAKELYQWATNNSSMKIFFCTEFEYTKMFWELNGRYERVQTIQGTQQFHSFQPISNNILKVKKYSESEYYELFTLYH